MSFSLQRSSDIYYNQNRQDAANAYFTGRFPGYRLQSFHVAEQTGELNTFILEPLEEGVVCPNCGMYCSRWKDRLRTIEIFDWDISACKPIRVVVPSRKIRCRCGCQRTESRPSWVLPNHLISKRLAAMVQKLLRLRISIEDVARFTGVDWALIKDLDKAALQLAHGQQKDLSKVRHLAIDEISIHKGHKYATVVMDLADRAIIHVVEGKRQADLQPFFDQLKQLGVDKNILSVSVDMNAAYPRLIKNNLPDAKLAYDRFHVMQQLNRQVLVEARKFAIVQAAKEFRQLPAAQRKDPKQRKKCRIVVETVRNAEWLVITDPSLLSPGKQERLRQLREQNQLFADLYAFVAKLKVVWTAASKEAALALLNECIELCEAIAQTHGFSDILAFGRMLRRRAEGIATACVVKFGTNILEGANNTAKVIKRVAYGFRDFEYFALKLMGAFPGRRYKSAVTTQDSSLVWNGIRETLAFPHYS